VSGFVFITELGDVLPWIGLLLLMAELDRIAVQIHIMKKLMLASALGIGMIAIFSSCKKDNDPGFIVLSATGNISPKVEAFRQLLGGQLNTTPGVVGGRREIDWDGVPEQMLGTPLPADFFNPVGAGAPASRQRGLVYSGDLGTFEVSKTNFSEINAAASSQFAPFSGQQTFSNISSNLWDVGFEVAGQPIEASVKGFGIVFSDVDLPDNSYLEFYNGNKSLGRFYVPAHDNKSGFSFLGVYFRHERVSRVKVSHGSGILNAGEKDITNGGSKDLVIMDDFLYDEPISR
jgi:hypothetical protein